MIFVNKKNGFTLVELLAVMIILILLLLLTIPVVKNIIDSAQKKSTKSNALVYVKAINDAFESADDPNEDIFGFYQISTLTEKGVKVKNSAPDSGFVVVDNKGLYSACLVYDDLKVVIKDRKITKIKEGTCTFNNGYNKDIDVYQFDYTGDIQNYRIYSSGRYLVEVWGAQGGAASNGDYIGGYGGYSRGIIKFNERENLYIVVGGQGLSNCGSTACAGGYNGGGSGAGASRLSAGSGGGATHIATATGQLKDLSSNKDAVIIVAGAGGGAYSSTNTNFSSDGANGGGFLGNSLHSDELALTVHFGSGGSQSFGGSSTYSSAIDGSFGLAGYVSSAGGFAGAGSGYFGGGYSSGAGSGYIGSSDLTDKSMYCVNCHVSEEADTKTRSITNHSQTPISNYAKEGNGYARISYLGSYYDF